MTFLEQAALWVLSFTSRVSGVTGGLLSCDDLEEVGDSRERASVVFGFSAVTAEDNRTERFCLVVPPPEMPWILQL